MIDRYTTQKKRYEAEGQGHVFQFWDKLSGDERNILLRQLTAMRVERVKAVFTKSVEAEKEAKTHGHAVSPLPADSFDSTIGENKAQQVEQWRQIGLEAIANGQVGVLLMAGGQGTRLGSSDPKGCYDIGLISHKPLFALQAERISRLQSIAESAFNKPAGSVVIPWYVMTSGPTRVATESFFEKQNYFGLSKSNVIFFEQGTLPCLDLDGKVLMDSTYEVAVAPDGNGGLYAATRSPLSPSTPTQTVLSDLKARKISFIHAYAVDNCLVRVADPVFLGYSIHKQADCATKVVPKSYPTEAVGIVAIKDSVFSVVEYSEISQKQAEQIDPSTGELAFRAANIVNHFYTTSFLESVESFEDQMAFHIARKKIAHVDLNTAERIKPTTPNGMKLELFVFDVFPFAKKMFVLEVQRAEEFSPLKNAPNTGSDDPQTSRADLIAQSRRFLERAGATVKDGVEVELSPLVTYAGEGLESVKGKVISRSGLVESLEALDALV